MSQLRTHAVILGFCAICLLAIACNKGRAFGEQDFVGTWQGSYETVGELNPQDPINRDQNALRMSSHPTLTLNSDGSFDELDNDRWRKGKWSYEREMLITEPISFGFGDRTYTYPRPVKFRYIVSGAGDRLTEDVDTKEAGIRLVFFKKS